MKKESWCSREDSGDGSVGENITENLKRVKDIPDFERASLTHGTHGEVACPRLPFDASILAAGEQEPEFANPRNVAAGTLRSWIQQLWPSAI